MSINHPPHLDAYSDDQIASVLSEAGVRVTRQRALIYSAIASVTTHPTAEELLDTVREVDERVSLATMYNTLDTLAEHGLLRRIPGRVSGGACRYDATTSPHVHIVMPDGGVADVPADLSTEIMDSIPAGLIEQLAERMGVRVTGIKIDLACDPE